MRKHFCKTILSLTLALLFISPASAQDYHEIKAKGLFPIGNFGRVGETAEMVEKGLIGSGATIGAGLGYRYHFDLSGGISLLVGGDVMWNMTDTKYRQRCYDNNKETAPQYFNIPIWVGVNYKIPLGNSNKWSAFFVASAGLNTHYTTSTGWENVEIQYKPALSPSLAIEVGFCFRNISLGFELLSLGKPTMKGTGEETYHIFKTLDKQREMIMGNIVLSYNLSKQKKEWKPSRKSTLEM